jgi:hypothetical protein
MDMRFAFCSLSSEPVGNVGLEPANQVPVASITDRGNSSPDVVRYQPTATQSPTFAQLTELSEADWLESAALAGKATVVARDHTPAVMVAIIGTKPAASWYVPTAVQSPSLGHATPNSSVIACGVVPVEFSAPVGAVMDAADQGPRPSSLAAKGSFTPFATTSSPTAVQVFALEHATAFNDAF